MQNLNIAIYSSLKTGHLIRKPAQQTIVGSNGMLTYLSSQMKDSSSPVPIVIITDQWHDVIGGGCGCPQNSAETWQPRQGPRPLPQWMVTATQLSGLWSIC